MSIAATKSVQEIALGEKQALEGILGTALDGDQQVFILAYTPGAPPDEETRRAARERLQERLRANQAFAARQGITAAEADEAIAEAMRATRSRN